MNYNLQDYWKLSYEKQEEIKAAHPTTPLKEYRVKGQLNLTYKYEWGMYGGPGFLVNQTVFAHSPNEAAQRVAEGWAQWGKADHWDILTIANHLHNTWLGPRELVRFEYINGGPVVTEIN